MGAGAGGNFGNTKGRKISLPTEASQIKHIFGDRKGHLTDTAHNRKLLVNTANNEKFYRGTDKYGNRWNTFIDNKGRQLWVRSRNGVINEGGRNDVPLKWNDETGLNKNPVKRRRKGR